MRRYSYVFRYLPLLLLATLIFSIRFYPIATSGKPVVTLQNGSAPTIVGSALYSVTSLSPANIWAVGGSFSIQRSPATFKKDLNGPYRSILDMPDAVLTPSSGTIWHYTNNVWVADHLKEPLRFPLFSVSLDSPQDGWAVGYAGTLIHYNGNQWSTMPGTPILNKTLLGVAMLSPSDGWAVGYAGTILHYDGQQWTPFHSPTTADLRNIAMSSAQEGWAVGDSGTILHYSDGLWHIALSPTKNTLNTITILSEQEGWAVGKQGTILHLRAGSWESVSAQGCSRDPYGSLNLSAISMTSIRSGWVVGDHCVLTYQAEVWKQAPAYINPVQNNLPAFALRLQAARFAGDIFPAINGIVFFPSGEGWAIGSTFGTKENSVISILHYQKGAWNVYAIR